MSFFTVNSDQKINDMLAYDLYRSFQSAFEHLKETGGTLKDVEELCLGFMPIDKKHPNAIDVPIPDIKDCRGDVTIHCKYNMIGIALTGFCENEPKVSDFTLADAFHGYYKDALTKQYYFHELESRYHERDTFLKNPENYENPLMKFIEQEVPFRLEEIHDMKKIDPDLAETIIVALQEDSDILFDYDAIDEEIAKHMNLFHEEDPVAYYNAKFGLSLDEMPEAICLKLLNGQFINISHIGREQSEMTGKMKDRYEFALYGGDAVSVHDALKIFRESGYGDIFMFFEDMLDVHDLRDENDYTFMDSLETVFEKNRGKNLHQNFAEKLKDMEDRKKHMPLKEDPVDLNLSR